MNKLEMIENVACWGAFVAFHEIGHYAFVEYHPRITEGVVITKNIDVHSTHFAAFVNGKSISESFNTLESAMAGAIAYRMEGGNHKADRYFMLALEAIKAIA